ncbi:MAG: hypothetical protein JST54_23690 [Deltaproteobacteria bacterium]|nr:hypothetical protein [Deltaproteobacteria bacterium]
MRKLMLAVCLAVAGCGADVQDTWDANQDALQATRAGAAIIDAAQFVGILPKYTCGEPERVEFADMVPELQSRLGPCATLHAGASTDTSDIETLAFAAPGCKVFGANWTGQLQATVSGGNDRNEVALDFTGMQINGAPVDARIGRVSCGDLTTWNIDANTRVPANKLFAQLDLGYHGTVVDRPGIFIIGTDYLILDGTAHVVSGNRAFDVTFKQVWWEPGLSVPHRGELDFQTPEGHDVAVRFGDSDSEIQVSVDNGRFAPVPVPGL